MAKERAYAIRLTEHEWSKLEDLATIHRVAASKVAREMVIRSLDRTALPLETRVASWVRSRLGDAAMDPRERAMRLLEESMELAQAEGVTLPQALALATHVFERPAGNRQKEGGAVAFCLLAWCAAHKLTFREITDMELVRLEQRPASDVQASVERKAAAGLIQHNPQYEASRQIEEEALKIARIPPLGVVYGKPGRDWEGEWDWMMANRELAQARFEDLRKGRTLPPGFGEWPRGQKVKWLNSNWPLES